MMAASHPEDEGGSALEEEAVVGVSYRVAATTSTSRVVAESCSSSRRRAMAQARASAA
jgi:hypothetical protein